MLFKMGDFDIKCPACCSKRFSSKPELVEHLASILDNIVCPICNNKWSSLGHLIEHLSQDDCQPEEVETLNFDDPCVGNIDNGKPEVIRISMPTERHDSGSNEIKPTLSDPFTSKEITEDGAEKMYVEVLSKQLMKPCLQTQELKLVKDNGVSRYLIMTNEDAELDSESMTIVTKQNNDGTISLTTVKDLNMKMETSTVITQENEPEESHEELYSCSTCGVSFTSLLEHIQNYHNDQDVVVEEQMDDMDNMEPSMSYDEIAPEEPMNEPMIADKQLSRRMITETGDIIETPIVMKSDMTLAQDPLNTGQPELKEEVTDKTGRVYTRRYVQIDKFCDSVVKNINQPDEKNGPYHKVVIKEVESTSTPGEKVKMFHCMSCNIYVSSLDQFKLHPCKAPKYKCPHCPVSYENSKSLCAHMKVHKIKIGAVTGTPPVFECEVCNTIFPSNKSLKLHKRMHDPTKVRPIEPPVETADGSAVSQDKFICSECGKVIPIDYRDIHQKSHRTTNNFNCDICNKKFHSSEYLEMHMSVHNLDKVSVSKQDQSLPYTCLYCERRFARPHEKVKHERIHTGEKPHSCEICGKSFRVSYCLTLHLRTHTGARPYACPHCGKRFKAHSVYNHHLLTHSEVRAYKCPYCPKAFKTSVQLAGHKNSHTKPFACQHCNRPFASLYQLRVHTETHARQNNLKFSCSMCGASYARAFALKDHVKQVHNRDADKADNLTVLKDGWIMRENVEAETEEMQISKNLPTEMNTMEIVNTNVLIAPN